MEVPSTPSRMIVSAGGSSARPKRLMEDSQTLVSIAKKPLVRHASDGGGGCPTTTSTHISNPPSPSSPYTASDNEVASPTARTARTLPGVRSATAERPIVSLSCKSPDSILVAGTGFRQQSALGALACAPPSNVLLAANNSSWPFPPLNAGEEIAKHVAGDVLPARPSAVSRPAQLDSQLLERLRGPRPARLFAISASYFNLRDVLGVDPLSLSVGAASGPNAAGVSAAALGAASLQQPQERYGAHAEGSGNTGPAPLGARALARAETSFVALLNGDRTEAMVDEQLWAAGGSGDPRRSSTTSCNVSFKAADHLCTASGVRPDTQLYSTHQAAAAAGTMPLTGCGLVRQMPDEADMSTVSIKRSAPSGKDVDLVRLAGVAIFPRTKGIRPRPTSRGSRSSAAAAAAATIPMGAYPVTSPRAVGGAGAWPSQPVPSQLAGGAQLASSELAAAAQPDLANMMRAMAGAGCSRSNSSNSMQPSPGAIPSRRAAPLCGASPCCSGASPNTPGGSTTNNNNTGSETAPDAEEPPVADFMDVDLEGVLASLDDQIAEGEAQGQEGEGCGGTSHRPDVTLAAGVEEDLSEEVVQALWEDLGALAPRSGNCEISDVDSALIDTHYFHC